MNENKIAPEVYAAALKLFNGNIEDTNIWLNRPQRALGGVRPVEAHPSEVLRLIGQLELGVYM